jgi:hypothetical protein
MIGLGTMRVSDATVQSLKAAGDYEYNSILSFGFHVGGEAGYMVQQRSSTLRGFGHSFATGIQIKAHYVSQLATDSNKSYTEFNRTDILYGPFVRYNLIF